MPLCIATGIEVSVDDPVHNRQIDTLIIHIPLCDATGIKESVDDPVHNHHIDTPSLPSTSRQNLDCGTQTSEMLSASTLRKIKMRLENLKLKRKFELSTVEKAPISTEEFMDFCDKHFQKHVYFH